MSHAVSTYPPETYSPQNGLARFLLSKVHKQKRPSLAPPLEGETMHPLEQELRALVRDPVLLGFFERATDGLWIWDLTANGVSYVTPAFARVIGFEPGEFVQGSDFWESRCHPDDWIIALAEVERATARDGVYDCTCRMRHKDGHWIHSRLVGIILRDENGAPNRGFGIQHNITELMVARARLEKETRHDPLTDLLNRRGIDEAMVRMLQQVQRLQCEAYAIVLDLDDFKSINDQLGHAGGDRVLVECAKCLRKAVRVVDECGRLGGDEFVVFLLARDHAEAEGVAERVKEDLAECAIEFNGDGVEITLSAALVPIYSEDGPRIDRMDILLQTAAPYLQKAKSNGKNQVSMQSVVPPPLDRS